MKLQEKIPKASRNLLSLRSLNLLLRLLLKRRKKLTLQMLQKSKNRPILRSQNLQKVNLPLMLNQLLLKKKRRISQMHL